MTYDQYLKKRLKDPAFRKFYEAARRRIKKESK